VIAQKISIKNHDHWGGRKEDYKQHGTMNTETMTSKGGMKGKG